MQPISSRASLSAVSAVHSLVKASKTVLHTEISLRVTIRVNLSLVVEAEVCAVTIPIWRQEL